jgi:hypothetical protein
VTLVLDASSPAYVWNPSGTSATTASFTPPAGSRIVIAFVHNTGGGNTPAVETISNTGTAITWTLLQSNNRPDVAAVDAGTAMWSGVGAGTAITVTAGTPDPATGCAIKAWVFTDTGGTPTIGVNLENASAVSSTATAQSYTATATGSRGVMSWVDWDAPAVVPTAGAGTTLTGGGSMQASPNLVLAFALQTGNDGTISVSQTLNLTHGTTASKRWIVTEVVPVASGAPATPDGGMDFPQWWPGDGPMFQERLTPDTADGTQYLNTSINILGLTPLQTYAIIPAVSIPTDAATAPATVAGTVTVPAVSTSAGSTPTPTTIAPPVVTVSGTASATADAATSPSTIAPAAVVISGTAQAGSTAAPGTISPTKVAVSGTGQAGATALPATIAPSVVTISGTAQAGAVASPATIFPPVVAISGTAQTAAGTTVPVSTIAPPVVTISGTAQGGATTVVSTIAPVKVAVSGTAQAGAVPGPGTIAPVKVAVSGTPATSSVAAPSTIAPPPVTVSGTATATPTPTTIAPPAVTVSGFAGSATIIGVSTVTGSTTVSGAANASAQAGPSTIAPAVVAISGSSSAASVAVVVTISPTKATVSGTVTVPAAAGPVTVSPPTVTIPAPAMRTGSTPAPATIFGAVAFGLAQFVTDVIPFVVLDSRMVSVTGQREGGRVSATGEVSGGFTATGNLS